jgi:hypothetical protein
MIGSARRLLVVAAVIASGLAAGVPAASADTVIPFTNWQVSRNLSLAKLDQSVNLPARSTFNGSVDLTTDTLSGNVNIPQFTSQLSVLGVPADATLQFVPVQPVIGTFTLGSPNSTIAASTSAIIRIARLSSPLLPILNLVPPSCETASPVVLPLDFSGPVSLTSPLTFRGTTTIPLLRDCGLATPLLDGLMSGPGNAFTVTISPPS